MLAQRRRITGCEANICPALALSRVPTGPLGPLLLFHRRRRARPPRVDARPLLVVPLLAQRLQEDQSLWLDPRLSPHRARPRCHPLRLGKSRSPSLYMRRSGMDSAETDRDSCRRLPASSGPSPRPVTRTKTVMYPSSVAVVLQERRSSSPALRCSSPTAFRRPSSSH